MSAPEMADNAIKALNNSLFNGANIVVERGRMKERKPQGPGGGPKGPNNNNGPQNNNRMNNGPPGGGNRGGMGGGNRGNPMNRSGPMGRGGSQMGNQNFRGNKKTFFFVFVKVHVL
jgi:hypothetical protein